MNVVCGVQARSSSTRLPGKVLMDLGGRPMILQLLSRLKGVGIRTWVLTSTDHSDDSLCDTLKLTGQSFLRGSLNDVRSRYVDLATHTDAQVIVRICGDSPFLEPRFIALAVKICEMHEGMCLVQTKSPCLLEGMDVFTTKALFTGLEKDAAPVLEHAGIPEMQRDSGVTKVLVGMGPDYQNEKITKLSIDTPEDMKFAQRFWEHLQRVQGDLRRAILTWGS